MNLTLRTIHTRPRGFHAAPLLACRALAATCVGLAVLFLPAVAGAVEVVRIAVAAGIEREELVGEGLEVVPIADGAAPIPVGSKAVVALRGETLVLDGAPVDAPGLRFTARGPLRHGALALEGEVEVRRGQRGLDVIHALPMEVYVAAVAGSEMPPSFPPEALKAQAVAARTFAITKKLQALAERRSYHLGATVVHQVYGGTAAMDPRAKAAAEATAGEVLVFDDEPADAFFHASCGGRTETGSEALGRDRPYLPSVACGRCDGTPLSRWTYRIDAAELGRKLGLSRRVSSVRVADRTDSGRARRVLVEAGAARVEIGGADFRQRLGWSTLKSLWFDVKRRGNGFVFEGRGAGHGAGMCQWGAAGLAKEGRTYREILAHYYPGSELRRMY
jgi:stage II sporulation protein D